MNMKLQITFALFIVFCACLVATAQQSQTPEQAREAVCQRVPCRPITTVRLKLKNKEYFEMEFPKGPYVADGFINVLAGEEILVELDDATGTLLNPHYVQAAAKPERTISFRLEQTEEGTILRVKNPFPKQLSMIASFNITANSVCGRPAFFLYRRAS
jgi:hypothetical protein